MSPLLIRSAEVDGHIVDVLIEGRRLTRVEPHIDMGCEIVHAEGCALLPGLHDHHIHLASAAAARRSVDVGRDGLDALRVADRSLPSGEWLRAVGYHESMAGDIDRTVLDALVPDRPVRLQHRSGMMWILNTAAVERLGPAADFAPEGFERSPDGVPTGRCLRIDTWLGDHVPSPTPDVPAFVRELRSFGVTSVTDMTPYDDLTQAGPLLDPSLSVAVTLTGSPALAGEQFPPHIATGPVKIVLDEHALPPLDTLIEWIRSAHRHGRPVAIHCVTLSGLLLALAGWNGADVMPGDRVEHGAVVTPDAAAELARLRIIVVTQPGFVAARGDEYLRDVHPQDRPFLWPCRSLLDVGVAVALATDAPYTPADPWLAIAAAAARTTPSGRVLGPDERISALTALDMFLTDPHSPGGRRRRIAPGAPADLCLLDRPLAQALMQPSAAFVRMSWLRGNDNDHPRNIRPLD